MDSNVETFIVAQMQAAVLILDDIEDRSLVRRGKACWYRSKDVGLMAINDGLMLENSVYYLIQKYFKKKECYVNLLETIHTVSKNMYT